MATFFQHVSWHCVIIETYWRPTFLWTTLLIRPQNHIIYTNCRWHSVVWPVTLRVQMTKSRGGHLKSLCRYKDNLPDICGQGKEHWYVRFTLRLLILARIWRKDYFYGLTCYSLNSIFYATWQPESFNSSLQYDMNISYQKGGGIKHTSELAHT